MRSALIVLLALAGCPNEDTETVDTDTDVVVPGDPVVVLTSAPFLQVGSAMNVDAVTVNGEVESYTWTSSDEVVASVDENGMVTGLSDGTVTITAVGDTTAAEGSVGIYVQHEIPHFDEWVNSAHADVTAEAFHHWDEDGEIPTSCARCHSTPGYRDYLGDDGTDFGVVDNPAPLGTMVECMACHNDAASELSTVIFPSGVEVYELGAEARCMTCHQGRTSGLDVEQQITDAGVDDDTVSSDIRFTNIHYYAAGATLYAGQVEGGYHYADEVYDWRFRHAPGVDTCIGCHEPHKAEVRLERCATCHTGVSSLDDLRDIRMMASLHTDYDGDGDRTEGIAHELDGLRTGLIGKIQDYTEDKGFGSICYDTGSYPYWFTDTDGDGACSASEADFANAWASWTPRLARAAYNYQVSSKDPGAFAHNAKYIIQLLHDATQDVNGALSSPATLTIARTDPGHFNGAGEPARHWDEDEGVSASCSKCHGGADGLRFYLDYGGATAEVEQDNGLECATCHENFQDFAIIEVGSVTFPGGTTLSSDDPGNLCSTCHSGRTGMADIDAQIATGSYRFLNVHYLPAAATRAGDDANVGYEYGENAYDGPFNHLGGNSCTSCHDPVATEHTFDIADNFAACRSCHTTASEAHDIRGSKHTVDVDGDGSSSESLAGELEGLADALLARMNASSGICYDSHAYPYWFKDNDGTGGECDNGEGSYSNQFSPWTPTLMKAAHNYQFWSKEPGAWAHNFNYMGQLLYDSLEDTGATMTPYRRP